MTEQKIVRRYNQIKNEYTYQTTNSQLQNDLEEMNGLLNCYILDKQPNANYFMPFLLDILTQYNGRTNLLVEQLNKVHSIQKQYDLLVKLNDYYDSMVFGEQNTNKTLSIDELYCERFKLSLLRDFNFHIAYAIVNDLTYDGIRKTDYLSHREINEEMVERLIENFKSNNGVNSRKDVVEQHFNYIEKHALFNFVTRNKIILSNKQKDIINNGLDRNALYGFITAFIDQEFNNHFDNKEMKRFLPYVCDCLTSVQKNTDLTYDDFIIWLDSKAKTFKKSLFNNNPYTIGLIDLINTNNKADKYLYHIKKLKQELISINQSILNNDNEINNHIQTGSTNENGSAAEIESKSKTDGSVKKKSDVIFRC